jgi:uncharacterized protein involved in exopolysaccharide biosynthesis
LLLFATAGAATGFFTTRPIYRATVRFSVSATRALGDLESWPAPASPGVLEDMARLAASRRVSDAAMVDRKWTAFGRPKSAYAANEFARSVGAYREGGSIVTVTFDDVDSRAAAAGVDAVSQAFMAIEVEGMKQDLMRRLDLLERQESAVANEQRAANDELRRLVAAYGTHDLDFVWKARFTALSRVEGEIADAELGRAPATRPATAPAELSRLKARYDRDAAALADLGRANLRAAELRERLSQLAADLQPLRHQVRELNLAQMAGDPVRMVDYSAIPNAPVADPRPRRAGWGALAGALAYALVALVVRWVRKRQTLRGKTGFPLFAPDPPAPRPVAPVESAQAPT